LGFDDGESIDVESLLLDADSIEIEALADCLDRRSEDLIQESHEISEKIEYERLIDASVLLRLGADVIRRIVSK